MKMMKVREEYLEHEATLKNVAWKIVFFKVVLAKRLLKYGLMILDARERKKEKQLDFSTALSGWSPQVHGLLKCYIRTGILTDRFRDPAK